ncbi:MAG: magnesium/cobalt transporter CorA [Leptolyngbyaceae cyanobacterium SM1_1_3]|nr:magnesium/cobalt transporter CorA [Leptolyngbyaceae cyanobacterium SM1_1_3]NJN04685.1 magnesium/cobalt transporter CorA [Leptolyngbyaceae cyanobacterium RM1_1_2]NJO11066.1 magnesium/cobalt transporter CorA [Leptolyngbyaceae cyanobacterium SL_1_1]
MPTQTFVATGQEEAEDYFDYHFDLPGSTPGTLTIEADALPPELVLIDYDDTQAIRLNLEKPYDCVPYLDTESVSWLDVQGLGSEVVLRQVGEIFGLHPLVLEDVVNVPQRPKVEQYEQQLLIIARMVTPKPSGKGFSSEQVSFILGKHYLLSVQEEPELDCFGPVRDRIRKHHGIIRQNGADYLAYTLLDAIIDGFFPVLEDYGELIEALEDEVVENPTRHTIEKIHDLRRELMALRRAIWPQRSAVNSLIRDTNELISPEVRVYLQDCYDHVIQVLDILETYRELASSLMDVYLSSVSNRMNEVMKLLTVISSIFIPLTFIAGVYGMNFNPQSSPWNMPELNAHYGYPLTLAAMGLVAIAMCVFFWRRGWFENFSAPK